MGTHHSKDLENVDNNNNNTTWQSPIEKHKQISSIHHSKQIFHGWQEICRCSHTDWLRQMSEQFGFSRHKFTCSSELHNICAPGFCSESLSRKLHYNSLRFTSRGSSLISSRSNRFLYSSSSSNKSKKLREHFEYNHIPAMISSLQNYSVHGIVNGCSLTSGEFEETIMLLIYSLVLDKTKFIIVDLKLNRFVCSLGDDYHGLIDVKKVHSAWSRDKTQVIVRLPMIGGSTFLDFYQINKKEAKHYRRISSVDVHTQFQFCPNYWSSRVLYYTNGNDSTSITLTNYNINALTLTNSNKIPSQIVALPSPPSGSSLSLINVSTWSKLKCEIISFKESNFRLLNILYTPDSVYIILTFADSSCHCNATIPLSYFDIYHGKTLQCLYRFETEHVLHRCPWHICRNFLTPIFSHSSARMAFCTTKNPTAKEFQVSIVVLPNELNLKSICRRLILDYLTEVNGKIEDITGELPYRLNQYLQYRPEYQ